MKYCELILVFLIGLNCFCCKSENVDKTLSETNTPILIEEENVSPKELLADSSKINVEEINHVKEGNADLSQVEKIDNSEVTKATTKESLTPKKKIERKPSLPKIVFENQEFDFGHIVQGEKVLHEFVFTNRGKTDLEINKAEATCGCTRPVYPFIPIEPGQEGKITVQFNSHGRLGRQNPEILIYSNASTNPIHLSLIGEVITEEYENKQI